MIKLYTVFEISKPFYRNNVEIMNFYENINLQRAERNRKAYQHKLRKHTDLKEQKKLYK